MEAAMCQNRNPAEATGTAPTQWQRSHQPLALAAMVFVVDFLLLRLTRQTGRISPIWFANALVLSILLTQPRSRWTTYIIASFAGNLGANILTGDRLLTAILLDLCNVIETLITGKSAAPVVRPWKARSASQKRTGGISCHLLHFLSTAWRAAGRSLPVCA